MLKLLSISVLQSALLAAGQIFTKLGLNSMGEFQWNWAFIGRQFLNFWWLFCGLSFTGATILWLYLLKNHQFSIVYPLTCLSYIFGMIAAYFFFNEPIPIHRWIGITLILGGSILIAQ